MLKSKTNRLYVFTNARNIREFHKNFDDEVLPKAITFQEFINRCVFLDGYSRCDDIERILFMQQAVLNTKKATSSLNFPTEFYEFMQNSEYLFSFFKEIAAENKSIKELKNNDIYAQYEEHLQILEELFAAYTKILDERLLYDDITLCQNYQINKKYVENFSEIYIKIDGILSEFEFVVLQKIKNFTKLIFRFSTSVLNKKLVEQISFATSLKFENSKDYIVDISSNKILQTVFEDKNPLILKRGFYLRSLQCAYVFEKISNFIRSGISAQKIAVILPDEEFAEILKLHDKTNMLNFAMGEKFNNTLFYEILSKIVFVLKEEKDVFLQKDYITQVPYFEKYSMFFNSCGLQNSLFHEFKDKFKTIVGFHEFKYLIDQIIDLANDKKIINLLQKPLFDMKILLNKFSMSLENICDVFLSQLDKIKIDHVGGGAIGVMGILESRGMRFDGVVIVDFNDDLVPKRSVNEMFLSSKVRQDAGLISHQDRENLQRFYYESLINKAKKVAICYEISEEKIPSRFLNYFSCMDDVEFDNKAYMQTFETFPFLNLNTDEKEIILKHDFFEKELSYSRLNTFLVCRRKYYYKYILGLKESKPFDMNDDYALKGKVAHESLSLFYRRNCKFDFEEFSRIYTFLAKQNLMSEFETRLNILNFKNFQYLMKEHEKAGWRVLEVEDESNYKHALFCGVGIYGHIDRIDINGTQKMIIDYKTGSIDTKSLQLAFYEALLARECTSAYLSLKDMCFIKSPKSLKDLEEEIQKIKEINCTDIAFARAKTFTPCRNCAYSIVCKRDI